MLALVRKFLTLDAESRFYFMRAWFMLVAMRLALRYRSFKRITNGLTLHRGAFEPAEPGAAARQRAQRVGWAVRAASRFTPWRSTCLVQVLVAQRLLRALSIPGAFYIGAVPDMASRNCAGQVTGLEAHAWLKCGNQFVTGEIGHERYTVVSAFSWP